METKNANDDEQSNYAHEIAEARIQQALLRYEYIKYKASGEAEKEYLDSSE